MIYRDRIAPYLSSSGKPGDRLAALKRRKPRTYLDLPYLAAQRDVTSSRRASARVINASRWLARALRCYASDQPRNFQRTVEGTGGGGASPISRRRPLDFYRFFLATLSGINKREEKIRRSATDCVHSSLPPPSLSLSLSLSLSRSLSYSLSLGVLRFN